MRNRNIWILLGAAVVILLLLAASRLFAGPGAVVTDSAPAMAPSAAPPRAASDGEDDAAAPVRAYLLVTVGGVQTNHGRLTAAAAAKAGLACTLVLDGARPEKLSGNLLLDCLLGASLVYTDGRSTSAVIEETLAAL